MSLCKFYRQLLSTERPLHFLRKYTFRGHFTREYLKPAFLSLLIFSFSTPALATNKCAELLSGIADKGELRTEEGAAQKRQLVNFYKFSFP
ncbi:MAG: hypothetical protein KDD40_00910, partial [Bdellovibrionales bacterium]|nr:hypothetical protein [Bdellovibrionales bacterium]